MFASSTSSRKALWIIIAGFSVVLVANATMVYFAVSTWTGLETEQHYAKGLAYNANLAGAKRQQALGWQTELNTRFLKGKEISGISEIHFTDKYGRRLTDLDVRIIASRPTHAGYDKEFTAAHTGAGTYQGTFTLPLKGLWDFRILARRDEDSYQRVVRIKTP